MAKGKFTGGRHFEKGNKHARKKALPTDVKEARKLRTADLERIIHSQLYMTREELKARMEAPECPMVEAFVGSVMMKGISEGDPVRMNHLMIWILGKPEALRDIPKNVPVYEIHRADGSIVRLGMKNTEGDTEE